MSIFQIFNQINSCQKCKLYKTKINYCYDKYANIKTKVVILAEAPGKDEDEQGIPLVGASGKLLDNILSQLHLERKYFYVANMLKCRPPNNRNPLPEELEACRYWEQEIEAIDPKCLLILGKVAAQNILNIDIKIIKEHGKKYVANLGKKQYNCLVTYHPAFLLYRHNKELEENFKNDVLESMKMGYQSN